MSDLEALWIFCVLWFVPPCIADSCGKAQVKAACVAHHPVKECKNL
jgi:hypothetical protein